MNGRNSEWAAGNEQRISVVSDLGRTVPVVCKLGGDCPLAIALPDALR